jgi:uncharacterized membrane protein YccC
VSSLPRPQDVTTRSLRLDRDAIAPLFGVRVCLVIGALLALWLALGRPYAAVWFALGAQFAAMTDPGGGLGFRLRNVALGSVLAAVSVGVGSLLAPSQLAQIVVVTVWGIGAALGIAFGEGRGKIGIVAAFALLGASQLPTEWPQPLLLALAVIGGGVVQLAAAALWRASGPHGGGNAPQPRSWPEVRDMIGLNTAVGRHAIRMAIGLAIAVILYSDAGLDRGEWVAIAVLLILRPSLADSADRTFLRVIGTVAGIVVVTGLVGLLGASVVVLAVLVALSEGTSFAFSRAQYGIQAGALGAAMVVLFAITGAPETQLADARILDTLIGALIAAAVTIVIREPKPAQAVG